MNPPDFLIKIKSSIKIKSLKYGECPILGF